VSLLRHATMRCFLPLVPQTQTDRKYKGISRNRLERSTELSSSVCLHKQYIRGLPACCTGLWEKTSSQGQAAVQLGTAVGYLTVNHHHPSCACTLGTAISLQATGRHTLCGTNDGREVSSPAPLQGTAQDRWHSLTIYPLCQLALSEMP